MGNGGSDVLLSSIFRLCISDHQGEFSLAVQEDLKSRSDLSTSVAALAGDATLGTGRHVRGESS